uniref:C2H2-type domain-containing protein n=1 Tax=Tetranychus urticae TaxID=32264 RepID=T1JWX8_TETUR
MSTRKRAARRDSDCSSNSRQQDSPLPSVNEPGSKVHNSHNKLVTIPPRTEAQLSGNLPSAQSIKRPRYSYEQAKSNNTTALNELQMHNLPQSSSGFSAQPKAPKPGTSSSLKAQTKSESKSELVIADCDSESEGMLDSKAEAKGKIKPELIPTKAHTENKPKSDVNSKTMAKAEVKPKLMPAKGGSENESKHSNVKEKQNLQPKKKVLHQYVAPCVKFLKRFLPKETIKCDKFISVLNDVCTNKKDPSLHITYEMPVPERCDYCMKKYRPDKLDEHMLKRHWTSKKSCTAWCPLCESIFTDHLLFAAHVIQDHANMSTRCILCHRDQKSRVALLEHYRKEILLSFVYRCRFCQSYFQYSHHVEKHLQDKHFIDMMYIKKTVIDDTRE